MARADSSGSSDEIPGTNIPALLRNTTVGFRNFHFQLEECIVQCINCADELMRLCGSNLIKQAYDKVRNKLRDTSPTPFIANSRNPLALAGFANWPHNCRVRPSTDMSKKPFGKVAFVTGANGITGNAIVEHLIRQPKSEWLVLTKPTVQHASRILIFSSLNQGPKSSSRPGGPRTRSSGRTRGSDISLWTF